MHYLNIEFKNNDLNTLLVKTDPHLPEDVFKLTQEFLANVHGMPTIGYEDGCLLLSPSAPWGNSAHMDILLKALNKAEKDIAAEHARNDDHRKRNLNHFRAAAGLRPLP